VSGMLRKWTLHVTHPRYFGLFNPSVRPVTVVADALAALYNPQLAVWLHAPAANEIERHALRFFSSRIGYDPHTAAAHFTSGGQEANMTSVVTALAERFPMVGEKGLRSLPGPPVFYVSEEAHHSFHKIAQSTGLGRGAIRTVPADKAFRMNLEALERAIMSDKKVGYLPFLVVGTAGTTSAGIVDPLPELAALTLRHGLWFHVDAAWGGGALLSGKLRHHLDGIDQADSVTWDAHKWLSVPLGAGMFFCRHPEAVSRAFEVSASNYVPPGRSGTTDNYLTSMQWSRRFIGLKVFMALAELGARGFEGLVEHQAEMANLLRRRLSEAGWKLLNETPLPVVCFSHARVESGETAMTEMVSGVNSGGRAWISEVDLPGATPALRACITSYRTGPRDIETLVEELERALG
jgi:aromatic-L-amino-acid decarboxylase